MRGPLRIQVLGACALLAPSLLGAPYAPDPPARSSPAGCASAAHEMVADQAFRAFQGHRFVFLGSTHGGVKRHEFLLCLLSRPGLQEWVTDVIVEFASGGHQETLDRYLIELEDLDSGSLRSLALDTDRPRLFATLPQVPEFLRALREINERLERSRRIRVIGGSETIDWSRVRSREDLASFPFKTNYVAHVITKHLDPAPGARALVVFGDGHIVHGGTLTGDIEAVLPPEKLFVLGTLTTLREGEHDRVARLGDPARPFLVSRKDLPDLEELPDDLFYARSGPLGEKIDALVYLGPAPDRNLQGTLALSEDERKELGRRSGISGGREAMEIRLAGRDLWFKGHPHEIPADPRGGSPSRGPSREPGAGERSARPAPGTRHLIPDILQAPDRDADPAPAGQGVDPAVVHPPDALSP